MRRYASRRSYRIVPRWMIVEVLFRVVRVLVDALLGGR